MYKRQEFSVPEDYAVADEAHLGASAEKPLGNAAARDTADLRHTEYLAYFRLSLIHI